VLFVPVSAPRGLGEYARAKEIATAVSQRWPYAQIRFVLSRMAPYARDTPFPATLLPSSPTYHSKEVAQIIHEFRPDIVIFDNAGRTAQLRAARAVGARIIYVSSRRRQRRKAFRLRWLRLIDEHWIAWPRFMAGALTTFERLKLRIIGRPTVRYLDVILPQVRAAKSRATIAALDLQSDHYVLVVPGGGTSHPGAPDGPRLMAEAAERLAAKGYQTVLIGPSSLQSAANLPSLRHVPRVAMAELISLIRNARLVIVNGGDTLLQALSCGRPCVAAPIAHDQALRIERCRAAGIILGVRLDPSELEEAALSLLNNEHQRMRLLSQLARFPVMNAMDIAMDAIATLLPPRAPMLEDDAA
jgi:UDP:flavonoid glycosyltransferase YjiC (YdhE family)